jgi:FkbM family methyltransferase
MRSILYDINHWRGWRTRVPVWGFGMTAPTLDRRIYLVLHRVGLMGADEKKLLTRLVVPGMQVLDVGANVGLYSLWVAKCAGEKGRVVAFEPVPLLFEGLAESCKRSGLSNIECMNFALGTDDGAALMVERAFNSGDGRMSAAGSVAREVRVEVRRLDSLLPGRTFDLIKIDVQGYELNVLRGMEKALEGNRQVRILFEYWPDGLRAAGTNPADLIAFLQGKGFSLYADAPQDRFVEVRPDELTRHMQVRPWGASGNFLAARSAP